MDKRESPVFPFIYETHYGDPNSAEFTARDARINSDLLRFICERLVNVKMFGNEFGTDHDFSLRIEDSHENDEYPHYVLDVGSRPDAPNTPLNKVVFDYCDNYSDGNGIHQERGKVTVYASSYVGNFSGKFAAVMLGRAYIDSLKEHFPDFFILIDDSQLSMP